MRVALVLLAAGFSLPVSDIQAQARVTGILTDTLSGKPVSGAEVFFQGTFSGQKSGKDGRFSVATRGATDTMVIIRRDKYVPVGARIDQASATVDLGTVYFRPIKNDGDEMAADEFELRLHPQLADFFRRKHEITKAVFFTEDEIVRSGVRNEYEVMLRNPQLRSACIPGGTCGEVQSKRGTTFSEFRSGESSSGCRLEYYANGRRLEVPSRRTGLEGVIAIEVYNTATLTPLEFKKECGALVVWTEGSWK